MVAIFEPPATYSSLVLLPSNEAAVIATLRVVVKMKHKGSIIIIVVAF